MRLRHLGVVLCLVLLPSGNIRSDATFPDNPILRLQPKGPTAALNALVFSPDGKTLYAAGYDKVVYAWDRGEQGGYALRATYRVPVGLGVGGTLNALALSPDGRWLAAAGVGLVRGATWFRETGFVMPRAGALTPEMLKDEGTIYLFDTKAPNKVRALREHRGPVLSMTFAPARKGKPAQLASLAREPSAAGYVGALRLWDVAEGEVKALASQEIQEDPGSGRPSLAAWPTGPGEKQLGVAVAMENQPLRVWDVAKGGPLLDAETTPSGRFNWTVAYLPEGNDASKGTLMTSHYAPPGAHLTRWRVDGAAALTRLDNKPQLLAKEAAPVALAAWAPPGGATTALAVCMFRDSGPTNPFRLVVFRPGRGEVTTNNPEGVPLWRGNHLPALAVSRDGQSVAAAGSAAHQVLVFRTDDLVKPHASAPERLRGGGVSVSSVEFASSGKDQGLLLKTGPAKEVVFSFSGRLITEVGKWAAVTHPDQRRWKVAPLEEKLKSGALITVGYKVEGPGVKREVRLEEGQIGTAHALLPPTAPLKVPVLAAGYVQRGVTYLTLYDARTGKAFRNLSGHVSPIRSLAFSQDGRLLASASEDRTVSVWGLPDVGKTLGQRGRLAGLALEPSLDKAPGVRVAGLTTSLLSKENAKALTDAKVDKDDVIEGIVEADGLRRFTSPRAFYEALWRTAPDTTLTLRVRKKGAVSLKVDQGIDDHPPLFSLFLPSAEAGGQWLAWSPSGPYDLGDIDLEGLIGWHKNPPQPGVAVEFSPAPKHRVEYRRRGIVSLLVKHAALAAALEEWKKQPVPKPRMSLLIDEAGDELDNDGAPVVRKGKLTLRAQVYVEDPAKVVKAAWQFDGGERRAFDAELGQQLTADLGGLKWKRGLHELRLMVTTLDGVEHTTPSLSVHYLPLAPTVRFDPVWLKKQFGDPVPSRPRVTAGKELEVAALVKPGDNGPDGPAVKAALFHNGKEVKGATTAAGTVRGKVALVKGANVLEVRAENEGAAADLPLERASARLEVEYEPPGPPPPAPEVRLESIQPEGGPAQSLLPAPDKAVIVYAPTVRLRGRVEARAPLTEVKRDGKAVAGLKAGQVKSFAIDETITLKPGAQTLKFTARAVKSEPGEQALKLEYRPEVPRLDPAAPRSFRHPAGPSSDFDLAVQLALPKTPSDYKAWVLVNDGKDRVAAKVSPEGRLSARVKLQDRSTGRDNRLVIVLDNGLPKDNGHHTRQEVVKVYWPQPPGIDSLPEPRVGAKPLIELAAQVRSPKGLPPLAARLNGEVLSREALAIAETRDPEVWTVRVKEVALQEGKNKLSLEIANADGWSAPRFVTPTYQLPPPEKAQVELVEPTGNMTVSQPQCQVRFRVRTASKATVRVYRDDKRAFTAETEAPQKPNAPLVYERTLTVSDLELGMNNLWVEAVNDGGRSVSSKVVVSYTPSWTVRVGFDKLVLPNRKELKLTDRAPEGLVWLHGHVEWRDAKDPALHNGYRLGVWVNEFRQFDVRLEAAKGRRREFRASVRLNRDRNRIELRLPPGLKSESDKPSLEVACAKPAKDQRLLLVAFGPGQGEKTLQSAVLSAFLSRDVNDKVDPPSFNTPAFTKGQLYVWPRKTGPDQARYKVDRLADVLRRSEDPVNDVVVFFFAGEESIVGKKHYLLTEASATPAGRKNLDETALDCDELRKRLEGLPGAKLLLLDARTETAGKPAALAVESVPPTVGFYRYVWLGKKDPPTEARLVHALGESLRSAPLVQDHVKDLKKWASNLGNAKAYFYPELRPEALALLQMGRVNGQSK